MRNVYAILLVLTLFLTVSCQEKKTPVSDENTERIDSLLQANKQKDAEINDMLATFNEIQEGLRLISEAEDKVTLMKNDETENKQTLIKENLQIISNQMKLNRELIAKLRKQMRESTVEGDQLKETINGLMQQIETKERELQALHDELQEKDIHIAELDEVVNNLNTNVAELTNENNSKARTISSQDKALNTAWYVFGTKKELKDQRIIEDDKVLQSSFNKNYFTKVDIRVDKEIKLYSKSAKILTNHPADSYTLQQDANKQYVLRILNPDVFWGTSKYLVILVK